MGFDAPTLPRPTLPRKPAPADEAKRVDAPRLMAVVDRPISEAERARIQHQLACSGERGCKPVILDEGIRLAQFINGRWHSVPFSGEGRPQSFGLAIWLPWTIALILAGILVVTRLL